ncbi:hypothetical protein [Sphingomonas parva]|nr:hypothetical protein [Sphingomonas parva]
MLSIAAVSFRFWFNALLSEARKPVTTMFSSSTGFGGTVSSLCAEVS